MPWYWTDDLARTLIDTGHVDRSRVESWLAAPVAIRSAEDSADVVADALLGEEEEEDGSQPHLVSSPADRARISTSLVLPGGQQCRWPTGPGSYLGDGSLAAAA